MKLDFDSIKPVYIQIKEVIEDDIISGQLPEGGAAYSQLTLAKALNVNPATAAKGINALVAKDILVKQRGASMTVAKGAAARLKAERRETSFRELLTELHTQAVKLGFTQGEVIEEIRKIYQSLEGKSP